MTEAELWGLLNTYNDSGMTALTLYLTVVSSYLITAYLVGADLTAYQVLVVSCLFIIFAGLFTFGTVGYFTRAVYFTTAIKGYSDASVTLSPLIPPLIGSIQIIGILVSLKFMWDIRHPKTE